MGMASAENAQQNPTDRPCEPQPKRCPPSHQTEPASWWAWCLPTHSHLTTHPLTPPEDGGERGKRRQAERVPRSRGAR